MRCYFSQITRNFKVIAMSTTNATTYPSEEPSADIASPNAAEHFEPDLSSPIYRVRDISQFLSTMSEQNKQFIKEAHLLSSDKRGILSNAFAVRMNVLKFVEAVHNLGLEEQIRIVPNENDGLLHLSDCIWSNDAATEGPDQCHCSSALENPSRYFRIKYHVSNPQYEDAPNMRVDDSCSFYIFR